MTCYHCHCTWFIMAAEKAIRHSNISENYEHLVRNNNVHYPLQRGTHMDCIHYKASNLNSIYLSTYSVEWQSHPWSILVNSSSIRSTMAKIHPRTFMGWSSFCIFYKSKTRSAQTFLAGYIIQILHLTQADALNSIFAQWYLKRLSQY